MKILMWSFVVLTVVFLMTTKFFEPPDFGTESDESGIKKSSIVLKWQKSGSITALPDRWTVLPGKPGYHLHSDESPYKVEVKYFANGRWHEYKGGSPEMKAFSYKSKTGEPEMFEFQFTKN